MKIKLEIDFGIGVDKHGNALDAEAVAVALRRIEEYTATSMGGCNIIRRDGVWANQLAFVREPGITLTALGTGAQVAEAIQYLGPYIKRQLNQECVMVHYYKVESMLL